MSNNKCCCKCSKKNPCGDTIKIQKDNIYKQFRNCCKNQKCLKYEYYLKMKNDDDGIVVLDNVLTDGSFSFEGYLDENNSRTYFNFGRTGDTDDWKWSFEVNLFYGSSPSEGPELNFFSATLTNDYDTRVYGFYNIKGYFKYEVKFNSDKSELHYINDVLYAKTYFGLSGEAKALNLLSESSENYYSYYNNIKLIDNNITVLDINMKKKYPNYLNQSVSNIPNFFLTPWISGDLNNSSISKV
jgi:hypothetical protein